MGVGRQKARAEKVALQSVAKLRIRGEKSTLACSAREEAAKVAGRREQEEEAEKRGGVGSVQLHVGVRGGGRQTG